VKIHFVVKSVVIRDFILAAIRFSLRLPVGKSLVL